VCAVRIAAQSQAGCQVSNLPQANTKDNHATYSISVDHANFYFKTRALQPRARRGRTNTQGTMGEGLGKQESPFRWSYLYHNDSSTTSKLLHPLYCFTAKEATILLTIVVLHHNSKLLAVEFYPKFGILPQASITITFSSFTAQLTFSVAYASTHLDPLVIIILRYCQRYNHSQLQAE
jgi:hypothetical protein